MHLLKPIVLAGVLLASLPAAAAEQPSAEQPAATGATGLPAGSPFAALEAHLRQRHIEVASLSVGQALDVMVNWYRLTPSASGAASTPRDTLVYRYGGWSEGCATGFKLSFLRRIADDGGPEQFAGITLMFEPAGGADLAPFGTALSDWPSLEAFMAAVEGSPAFKRFGGGTPMSVGMERGGLR